MRVRCALFAVVLALPLVGCAPPKLDESRTWSLLPGEAESLDLPAISKAQKVTVDFTSTSEVTVLLIKESDAAGQKGLAAPDESKALAKQKGKSGNFSADVPANTATRVIATGATAKADVNVKVTNSK